MQTSQTEVVVDGIDPSHGPGGSLVTLTGGGFSLISSENEVRLNNMSCEITSATSTELKVRIPMNAGSGPLQVTVRGAQTSTTDSPQFTYDLTSVTVTTLTGGQLGYADGPADQAKLWFPVALAFDSSGLLFVSDSGNRRIRAVGSTGAVTTIAGSGADGLLDGNGQQAAFSSPNSLAFDGAGNLFIADSNNFSIREMSPTREVITTIGAGEGLSLPWGLAFSGDALYISDKGSHRILKVTAGAGITTFAGSGTPGDADGYQTAAQLQFPAGIAFCSDGNLFVADEYNFKIRKVTPAGEVTTYAGDASGLSYQDGPRLEARFLFPVALVCDEYGKLFVVDNGNNKIRMTTPSGIVSTLAGSSIGFADGDGTTAKFSSPAGITIGDDGALYVADTANNRIRKIIWE